MIALILPLIARLGVTARFQRLAAWIALVVAVIALCGLLWLLVHRSIAKHDEAVVADRDRDVTIEASERVMNAWKEADANMMVRQEQAHETDKELSHEVEKGTDDRAGPATAGVLAKLREQQAANRR